MHTTINVLTWKIICEHVMVKKVSCWVNGKEVIISNGNYDGTSKGMEAHGFHASMGTLTSETLLPKVKTIMVDEDSSVKKIIAEVGVLAHIKVLYLPLPFYNTTKTNCHTLITCRGSLTLVTTQRHSE
jgi:hypothetical protein